MTSLHHCSISELAPRLASGDLSAETCVEAVLSRITALDPGLHAFTLVCAEQALEQARVADRDLCSGHLRGPLHGVPFALKDIIDVKGLPTGANSHVMNGHRATRDAWLAQRLQRAGAILIGKLNTNEFACGGPPEGCPHPTPLNPWNASYVTGGSSSGSAVAVAAGLVPLAIGTDTNGSIRQPAARCGIVGMKPTYGRISRDGIFPLAPSLDHAGPMTRTVADNALALAAMAGFDANDATSRQAAGPAVGHALDRGVAGLRVGAMRNIHLDDPETDPEQAAAYARALDGLARAGAKIIELKLPEPTLYTEVARALMSAEAYSVHEPWLRDRGDRYGRHSRTRLMQGALISSADYLRAQRLRERLNQQFHALLDQVDAVVTTACHAPHPKVDDQAAALKRHLGQALMIFNVTGLPAMVLPVGLSSEGLPLTVQVAARAFDEATVYRVGRVIEQQACLAPWPTLR